MKTFKKITGLALLLMVFTLKVSAGDDLTVQYIAVHFGDASYNEVLNKSEFQNFDFYTADGKVIGYTEDQKMMGNPEYLMGWYGEVPEKMGFCANYRGEYKKYYGFPYEGGVVYVIDKNGTIAYQSPPTGINPDKMDEYNSIRSDVNRAIRRARKGKEEKVMKERKREYLKEAPVGELEERKGSDIDKDGEGLMEWPVPDLKVKDEDGNEIGLQELTKGKATVLVMYTMNGVTWKKGDTKGNIKAEWKGNKLLSPEQYSKKAEKDFEKEADEDKGAFGNAVKFMGKEAAKAMGDRKSVADIWSAEGDLPEQKKMSAYQYFLEALKFVDNNWGEK